jgi:hypothetical protein
MDSCEPTDVEPFTATTRPRPGRERFHERFCRDIQSDLDTATRAAGGLDRQVRHSGPVLAHTVSVRNRAMMSQTLEDANPDAPIRDLSWPTR